MTKKGTRGGENRDVQNSHFYPLTPIAKQTSFKHLPHADPTGNETS
jgi:hypothetical protein